MYTRHHSDQSQRPQPSKKWHYRKRGLASHSKARQERRDLSVNIRSIVKEYEGYENCDGTHHVDAATDLNIQLPKKRNGSAKSLRERHPRRRTRKIPVGHSGWTVLHGPYHPL